VATEDASIHVLEMQRTPCSLVYHGALDCEGARMRCGARNKAFYESLINGKLLTKKFVDG